MIRLLLPSQQSSLKRWRERIFSSCPRKKPKRDSFTASSAADSLDRSSDQPPLGAFAGRGVTSATTSRSSAAGSMPGVGPPANLQLFADEDSLDSAARHRGETERDELSGGRETRKYRRARFRSSPASDPNRKDPRFNKRGSAVAPLCSQFATRAVAGPPSPQGGSIPDSAACTEGGGAPDAFDVRSARSDGDRAAAAGDAPLDTDAAVNYSAANALPGGDLPRIWSWEIRRDSSRLPRCHSMPSLSQTTSEEKKTLRAAESLPDIPFKTTYKWFTPDMAADGDDGSYRFWCCCPGLYRCSVTGLGFHMEGAGNVDYRTVPWDRRLLARHHKRPAGPLFDIKCAQRSMSRLHLPHCEINGGRDFLSVAHVNDDDGVEFIDPHEVTESHIVINITGFSGFGNVKDEDSPPDPIRALVLLFYRPPADPDPESLLNVLLLPRNVVLQEVLRIRKMLVGDECYVETSPYCKLYPNRDYALSTRPQDDSLVVQPAECEFDCDNYDNFFPSFQVSWETTLRRIELILRDIDGSRSVWERRVCLSSAGVRRSCEAGAPNLPTDKRLLSVRSDFVERISPPVLKSLLDRLFEKTVLTHSERRQADEMLNTGDKARFVIDTVTSKGEAGSSEMIEFFCEVDPFLCEHLKLM